MRQEKAVRQMDNSPKNSTARMNAILRRWGRRYKVNLGQHACAGYALFASKKGTLHCFTVEGIGVRVHNLTSTFSYLEHPEWRGSQFSRKVAFKRAKDLFWRLSG